MWPLRNTVLVLTASSSVLVSGFNFAQDPSPGCPVCADRNILKEMTKNAIKEDILRKLGLSSPPSVNVTELMHVQPLIEELTRTSTVDFQNDIVPGDHHQSDAEDEDHFRARSITILPTPAPLHTNFPALYFQLPHQLTDSDQPLEKAELSLHLPAAPSDVTADSVALIRVYHVFVDKMSNKTSITQIKSNKVQLRTNVGGRVNINLTRLTRIWQKNPEENLGIVVKAHIEQSSHVELEIGEGPYLTIQIPEDNHKHRPKRSSTNRFCQEEWDPYVSQCCLWPLTIDFHEFGWDWVLSPRTYEANFCSGDCSLGLPDTNHGTLTQQHIPGPCCSAKKKSEINIQYLDPERNVIFGKLPDMKIERCGCV